MSKRGSLTSAKSLHELKREPLPDEPSGNQASKADNESKATGDEASSSSKGIRPSKSETSIIDSFVVVENEYARRKNNANALREGKISDLFTLNYCICRLLLKIFAKRLTLSQFFLIHRLYVASSVSVSIKTHNAHGIRSQR